MEEIRGERRVFLFEVVFKFIKAFSYRDYIVSKFLLGPMLILTKVT
mgnify:CR=1 FL=1